MRIEVFADLVCPFCAIGERRLELAIDRARIQWPELKIDWVWRPFQLRQDLPPGGMAFDDFIQAKFGGRAQAEPMFAQISRMAAQDGLTLDFARITRFSSTADAHRMILWASSPDRERGRELALRLYRAHFSEGVDLGDRTELARLAGEVGLDSEEARRVLEGVSLAPELSRSQDEAEALGIRGVPFVIFDRKYAISGAQSAEVFFKTLEKAALES